MKTYQTREVKRISSPLCLSTKITIMLIRELMRVGITLTKAYLFQYEDVNFQLFLYSLLLGNLGAIKCNFIKAGEPVVRGKWRKQPMKGVGRDIVIFSSVKRELAHRNLI